MTSLNYGLATSSFGTLVLAWQGRVVWALYFTDDFELLFADFRGCDFLRDDLEAQSMVECILGGETIGVNFHGSPLQEAVWYSMMKIPAGSTTTYSALTAVAGYPRAVRAVATAVGQNPISYLIPCHRVVSKDGSLGGYRWGISLKEALLKAEQI
ncbi:MAG: MGMT family protein [Mucinivorans sp.]